MIKTVWSRRVNLILLQEEFEEQIPSFFGVSPDGKKCALYTLSVFIDYIEVDHPDGTDPRLVLVGHDPDAKSRAETAEEKRKADRTAGLAKLKIAGLTDDELKALFGLTEGTRVSDRMRGGGKI